MIQLEDKPCPVELTEELIAQLTEEYQQTGKSVWKKEFIAEQLLAMSNGKCCFSECRLEEEGKYPEVEHFAPKSLYPQDVVKWENLLPISSACNKSKGDHDTRKEPIINPRYEDPKEHFYFQGYRFKPKTPKGHLSIEVLNLNDRILWVNKRFEIGDKAVERLEEISKKLQEYDQSFSKSTPKQNSIVRQLRNLFHEGTPKAEYSAVVASYLLNDDDFQIIKDLMQKNNLWDEEFESLEKQLKFSALDVREPKS
ncbi:hypothetical protein [Runella salmonicolor]|uniref:TIGR02646 family protein n=1 Tax=Runella salmonicolor TaxID=2950278 RepID=A0ABT1FVE5_9BACT|nr:hypothetical protein [Runella salmonicolor]MCP1385734.1 hypothetical protein [Runella salmonicolor]